MSHGHPHGPDARGGPEGHLHDADHQRGAHGAGRSLRRLGWSLALTAAVMVAEAIGGVVSGSLSLVSDAGHMLTDAGALGLILEITDILMEAVPRHLDLGAVTRQMEGAHGVIAVHDLHIWTISSGLYALSAHVVVHAASVGRNDEILTVVKSGLRREFAIDHTTIQIESADYAHVDDVHRH